MSKARDLSNLIKNLATGAGSALVGFLQVGAGAVLRTLQDKTRETVAVTDYGAKSDGSDATAAIQAALNTGKNVLIPDGTFLSGPLTLSTPGQCLYGRGISTVLQFTGTTGNLLTVFADNVTIRDLRLNGVSSSDATSSFAVFTSSAAVAQSLSIRNVLISGTSAATGFNNAIKIDDGCNRASIVGCTIERLWGGANSGKGYGVLIGNSTGSRVKGCKFIATTNAGAEDANARGRHGVYTSSGASYTVVSGNHFEGFLREAISQDSVYPQPVCSYNVYAKNTFTNCAESTTNAASGAIGIYRQSIGAIIYGNTIRGSGQKGVTVDNLSSTKPTDTLIAGNVITYSGSNGISVTSASRTAVVNNIVHESGQLSVGAYSNIMLRSDGTTVCDTVLITGNTCGGTANARSCFSVDPAAGGPTNVRVTGNMFRPCQSYTIELNGVSGIEIDGRLQYVFTSVSYGPIANGGAYTGALSLPGAAQGDICTASHTSNSDGCAFAVQVSSTNTGVLSILNNSGASKTISSGTLRVDVWKRYAQL